MSETPSQDPWKLQAWNPYEFGEFSESRHATHADDDDWRGYGDAVEAPTEIFNPGERVKNLLNTLNPIPEDQRQFPVESAQIVDGEEYKELFGI
jgi:hypothetical protein